MESNISIVFSRYITALKGQQAWWYGIDIDPKHDTSLCQLLRINPSDYASFLCTQGFVIERGGLMCVSSNNIEMFCNTHDGVTFARQVFNSSTKQHYFLRIGTQHPDLKDFSLKRQLREMKNDCQAKPPRTNRAAIVPFSLAWSSFLHKGRDKKESNNHDQKQHKLKNDDNKITYLPVAVTPNEKDPSYHNNRKLTMTG